MSVDRVKFQDIVESQLPRYVREEFPLLPEFLKQYYVSQEFESGTFDIVQNIDKYVKLDEIFNLSNSTVLRYDVDFVDTTIETSYKGNFTDGFPDNDGLIQIDNEIIYYKTKTNTTFEGCVRGFSGISSYISLDNPEQLVFQSTESEEHKADVEIVNLNVLFLQEFFKKLKKQFAPGFDDRQLDSSVDKRNLIYGLKSFYQSKGTDSSFKILFNALYGKESEVIRPTDFLFRPSDADYRVTEDMVVERLEGNPLDLDNQTLFQVSTGAKAIITKVQPINYDKGQFYQVGIDLGYDRDIDVTGTKFADFRINPKTRLLNSVSAGSTILDVDSTVGFAQTGYLIASDSDGNSLRLNYLDKSVDQFFSVEGVVGNISENSEILEDDYSYSYVGFGTENIVRVRIGCSLNEFIEDDKASLIQKDEVIFIKSLGAEPRDIRSKGWFSNIKTTLDVEGIDTIDDNEKIYEIRTYDSHYYYAGVNLLVYNNAGLTVNAKITRISSNKSFIITAESKISNFSLGIFYKVESQLLKTNTRKYPKLKGTVTNIQNTYSKFNGDTLVASNSIPSLLDKSINPNDKKYTFSGSADEGYSIKLTDNVDHGFYTGDTVYYQRGTKDVTTFTPDGVEIVTQEYSGFDGIDDMVLYVKRVDQQTIKLARGKSDIFVDNYLLLQGVVENISISEYKYWNKGICGQKIVREIVTPDTSSGDYSTEQGKYNGIFLDGVEILNYKSTDKIYYGQVRGVSVVDGGSDFDIITPPLLHIEDLDTGEDNLPIGTGATGNAAVNGSLKDIRIIDTGFDYVQRPFVSITGGSGENAAAEVNTTDIVYSISFNAGVSSSVIGQTGGINTTTNTIGFSTYHKFRDNERVIYETRSQEGVIGLSTNSVYHVNVVDPYRITLHNTFDDSNNNVNILPLTEVGRGIHDIKSEEKKTIVTSVIVTNPGSGYQNKKRKVFFEGGVITGTNTINIVNHGYESGQIVNHYRIPGEPVISGLDENTNYYVQKVDENNFHLSPFGTGSVDTDYYYKRNIYVDLKSRGAGYFNYQPIVVSIDGVVGVSTLVGQDFRCKVQPVFRGSIDSVDITEGGSKYGSEEILNFNRTPVITFKTGEGAKLRPVILDGEIVDVVIEKGGSNYYSVPDLVIRGEGQFARIAPVIRDGIIVDVVIEQSGIGYSNANAEIEVVGAGRNYNVDAILDVWNLNEYRKRLINIDDSDSFVSESTSGEELQICHIYAPRELRESVNSLEGDGSPNYGKNDLTKRRGVEVDNNKHSPIIGWAYDGNPIYGPYGFANGKNGKVKQMESGYNLISIKNSSKDRPSRSLYPGSFFIEDYVFTNKGDLDKHNGRFCITPDYPNGTYAYFTTFTSEISSKGVFKNFKTPRFPYVVGDSFKFNPNQFNLRVSSNQSEYDFESNGWFRNTDVYHLNDDRSGYQYIVNSSGIQNQSLQVTGASKGNIKSVGIVTGGNYYKVGDRLVFNNEKTSGSGAKARVSRVEGKEVIDVRSTSFVINNVEFVTDITPNTYIGFSSAPTNLEANDSVRIDGISDYVKGFDGQYNVGVRSDSLVLTLGVNTSTITGVTTYFYVSGSLEYPFVRPNDILGIGTERVKVLNIDKRSSRIRVSREQDSTFGVAHTNNTILREDPRKFRVNIVGLTTTKRLRTNEEYYFIPEESVGVGTILGVGVGYTALLSDSGVGNASRFLTPQSIFIPDHNLTINDELYYNPHSNTGIEMWNGVEGTPYTPISNYDKFYAVPLTEDTIGLSTQRTGIGTTSGYSSADGSGLIYFTNSGNGEYQSFISNFSSTIKGNVSKDLATVSTASTHGMKKGDSISFKLNPLTKETVVVTYNIPNRRILFGASSFTGTDLNLSRNTIKIENHGFTKGDKVVYLSQSVVGGLTNNSMYYVIPYDENNIQLIEHRFDVESESPNIINLTSSGNGSFSKINPLVKIRRNQILEFDLSDQSLSFLRNDVRYGAFEMNIFSDYKYLESYISSSGNREFEVTSSGVPGIDSDAKLTIYISDNIPKTLWYNFELQNLDKIDSDHREYYIDDEAISHNQISVEYSEYNGFYDIVGVGLTSFDFNLNGSPKQTYWDQNTAKITYDTKSTSAEGPISKVTINSSGHDYLSLPGITSVRSVNGKDAYILAESDNIGNILKTKYRADKIGFDYPTDQTMRVVSNVPEVISVNTLATFDFIGIASQGRNYLIAPDLVVIDGLTNEVVTGIDLKYKLGDPSVTIKENTTGLYPVEPRIVAINNSNGVGINSITYNQSTKKAQAFLRKPIKNLSDFPFKVNDEIFIENTSLTPGSTGFKFNSSDYTYAYFKITAIDPNVGGFNASVTYDMSKVVSDTDVAGDYDISASIGKIIQKSSLPIFKPQISKSDLLIGETLIGGGSKAKVISWNPIIEVAKITSRFGFEVGDKLVGQTTGAICFVSSVNNYDSEITTTPGATIIGGWERSTGFMNNSLQRLPNNEYYQNFSYSIASEIPLDQWDDAVSAIAHPAGVQKFSDLQIISVPQIDRNPLTIPSEVEVKVEIISESSIHTFFDFDDVTERTSLLNGSDISREIYFENRILTDHFESVSNRVYLIDDISKSFNSNTREDVYIDLGQFDDDARFNRMYAYVKDTTFVNERQFSITSLIHDKTFSYTNTYSNLVSNVQMGYFEWVKNELGWTFRFYPTNGQFNSYELSLVADNMFDKTQLVGNDNIGITSINCFKSENTIIGAGSSDVIVSYGTSYRSAKTRVLLIGSDQQDNEITYGVDLNTVHNGTDVSISQYGDITTLSGDSNEYFLGSDIGTFDANIVGGEVQISFEANPGIAVTTTSTSLLTSGSEVGIGSTNMKTSKLLSNYVNIPASATPIAHSLTAYGYPYESAVYYVTTSDTTGNNHEFTEISVMNTNNREYITEFGSVITGEPNGIGTFGVFTDTSNTVVTFTPEPNIDVDVRIYGMEIQVFLGNDYPDTTASNFHEIINTNEVYKATQLEQQSEFLMKSDGDDIFIRNFRGDLDTIVGVGTNTVTVPYHKFETGDRITYNGNEGRLGTSVNRIGIAETSIAGVTTDKLPRDCYIVKYNDAKVAFAESAADALLNEPKTFQITSAGFGTFHQLKSHKTEERTLILIDNMIQSPLADTDISTFNTVTIATQTEIRVAGITSFFSDDIIRINDEYMLVIATWFEPNDGNYYMKVVRGMMGSRLSTHNINTPVFKVSGQYNIVENSINFIQSPKGSIPLSTTSDPDESDWAGITTHSSFQGRVFNRTSFQGAGIGTENYALNHVYDDISNNFTGIRSDFVLKYEGQSVTGVSTDNAVILVNGIFQHPDGVSRNGKDEFPSYSLSESLNETNIRFLADPYNGQNNTQSYPRGGILMEVGSQPGFGYQPLVSAGGTAIVSGGAVTSVSIGNSGSGYRSGLQTVRVGVQTYSNGIPNTHYVGIATISDGHVIGIAITDGGSGYNTPPNVVIDSPLPYANVPLVYNSSSLGRAGTGAKANIVVGNGSSVIDFELSNTGVGYGDRQQLTVAIGGTVGIPTTGSDFSEFIVDVGRTQRDTFNSWFLGEIQVFDDISDDFDGETKTFNLKLGGEGVAVIARKGSQIDVKDVLLVFINGVLQDPTRSYGMQGGSVIRFNEAPKSGEKGEVFFYKGTRNKDVIWKNILETVKEGDIVNINNNPIKGQSIGLSQDDRPVTGINTVDSVTTSPYVRPGVTTDTTLTRPVSWSKQLSDVVIDGVFVGKDRMHYEPNIFPFSYLIQSIGVTTSVVYVDSVKPLFDSLNETSDEAYQNKIQIISQDVNETGIVTAIVGPTGSIVGMDIVNSGIGYTANPTITIPTPSNGQKAIVDSITQNNRIVGFDIIVPGEGYSQDNPPVVLVEPPRYPIEIVDVNDYSGDYGIIVGFGTNTSGDKTQLIFDFYIPLDSWMRDQDLVSDDTTISGISTGDFFTVFDSNGSHSSGTVVTKEINNTTRIGISTDSLDNIYQVDNVSTVSKNVIGVGVTDVRRVFTNIVGQPIGGVSFDNNNETLDSTSYTMDNQQYVVYSGTVASSQLLGRYSWGKIDIKGRPDAQSFNFYGGNGYSGLTTSTYVRRYNDLKFKGYDIISYEDTPRYPVI